MSFSVILNVILGLGYIRLNNTGSRKYLTASTITRIENHYENMEYIYMWRLCNHIPGKSLETTTQSFPTPHACHNPKWLKWPFPTLLPCRSMKIYLIGAEIHTGKANPKIVKITATTVVTNKTLINLSSRFHALGHRHFMITKM